MAAAGPRRVSRIGTAVLIGAVGVIAAVIVVTTVRALFVWYLPVPVADTWEGSYAFTRDATGDFLGALWRPHNEHRIVLTKLLFWFNNSYLGGGNAFLIGVNVALTAAVAAVTAWLTAAILSGYRAAQWIVALASVGTTFAWMHQQNLVWEFQSQFYFAVLFSLLAMTVAGWSRLHSDVLLGYVAAVGCALLALMSMGAGAPAAIALGLVLLALPAPRRVVVVAGVVMVGAVGWYLRGLGDAPADPDVVEFLTGGEVSPLSALVTFLGAPGYWGTGSVGWAQLAGAAFLTVVAALMLRTAIRVLRGQPRAAMETAGLGYLLVVAANAVSAALLRSDHGALALVGSRYQILVLTGWLVLAAITAAVVGPAVTRARRGESAGRSRAAVDVSDHLVTWVTGGLVGAILVLMVLPAQLASATNPADPDQSVLANPARRMSAALGVELGVPDRDFQLPTLYYRPGAWPALSEYVRDQQWAIFGGRFRELRETLDDSQDDFVHVPCEAVVDGTQAVPQDPAWTIVRGQVVGADGEVPELVQFTDSAGVIVGYASTGFYLEDAPADSNAARYGGFRGYVRTEAAADLTVGCVRR